MPPKRPELPPEPWRVEQGYAGATRVWFVVLSPEHDGIPVPSEAVARIFAAVPAALRVCERLLQANRDCALTGAMPTILDEASAALATAYPDPSVKDDDATLKHDLAEFVQQICDNPTCTCGAGMLTRRARAAGWLEE